MNNSIIIIGAGIVGLATAVQILKRDPSLKVIILEKESEIAKHQTGNNSGVIHSGIYYKLGSLKATNCRKGYNMLLQFCNENNIKYDICGKIIVATKESELDYLETLFERGKANGLKNLKILSAEEIKKIEPEVNAIKGIFVPQTGIIDYTEVSEGYKKFIEAKGGRIIFNCKVKEIKNNFEIIEIITNKKIFKAEKVISCAGLQSDRIAKLTNPELPLRIIPFKGEYFELKENSRHKVKSLIYPVPDPAFPFLGVHFTRGINGSVECGPNAVFSFAREGYKKFSFNLKDFIDSVTWVGFLKVASKFWKVGAGEFYRSFYKPAFVKALQKLIPSIRAEELKKGGAGIRAQACHKNGNLIDDFYIVESKNVIHICNAPSPAATASLAIGEFIAAKVLPEN